MNRIKQNRRWVAVVGVVLVVLAFPLWRPLFVDDVVDESFPMAAQASDVEAVMESTTGEPLLTLRVGSFVDGQGFYQAEGTATIYQLADGSRVLRFENFRTTNGPQLHVYLASNDAPEHAGELGRYLDLGALKGNVGDQNYVIPAEVDLSQFNSVVIYCVPFERVFGYATLTV